MTPPSRLSALGRALSYVLIPLAMLALTAQIVDQRSPSGESRWLSLSPDTHEYVRMVEGQPAAAPYTFRVLAPLFASWLPVEPLTGLLAVTYLSWVLAYALLAWTLIALAKVRAIAAWLAVLLVMTSTRSLLLVQNPYLTDALGFLWMVAMLACLLARWPWRFGGASVFGVLAREDALFGAFGYLAARRTVAGVLIVLGAVAAYIVPRLGHAPGTDQFVGLAQLMDWRYYAKSYFALGFVWGLTALGMWLALRSHLSALVPYCACALAGSLLATLFAVDTTRVFLPLLPLAAVGTALVLDRVASRRWLMLAWGLVAALSFALALPNVFFAGAGARLEDLERWYAQLALPIVVHQLVAIALLVVSARLALARAAAPAVDPR